MQVENEYGSYGDDHTYMREILSLYQEADLGCLLFTSDGPQYFTLNGGSLPELLSAVNFGSNPKDNFALLRQFKPNQPLFCCEFWNGWFDHWYEAHHLRDADDTATVLEEMLTMGASVNLYMFHGGTNFGFTNGANFSDVYQPTVTSYDYNCPLSESGDLTPKYFAIQKSDSEVLEDTSRRIWTLCRAICFVEKFSKPNALASFRRHCFVHRISPTV